MCRPGEAVTMSQHLIELLDDLKTRLARMTALVQQAVERSTEAVLTVNQRLAAQVIAEDKRIDEQEVAVERDAIELIATHSPAASDLRLLTTIIKVNGEFERIADCAVNVAQRVQYLKHVPRYEPPVDLRVMASSVTQTLRDTILAFNLLDEQAARQVLRSDDVIDALYGQIVHDMLTMMESDGQLATMDLSNIMVAKNLERIGDHCTNIAENVIYVHTGRIVRHSHAAV